QTTQLANYSCSENNVSIQFTLSSSSHSAWNPTSNCSLQQCDISLNGNNNCLSSSTPCFDYRTINNISYCAPGILCSILERCDNNTQTCSSNSSVCIINSCCSPQAVCLPLLATQMCNTGCVLSAQSQWNQTGVTVAGNPSGANGIGLNELYDPVGFYYDEASSTMYIGDGSNLRVLKWSLGSSLGTVIAANGYGIGCVSNQFDGVAGVAFDSYGHLYTSATCGKISKFPPNSNSTTIGVLVTQTSGSEHIFIDPLTDDLYAVSYADCSIVKIARNNTYSVVIAGGNGCGNGLNQFNGLNGAYVYENSLYVVDSGNHRIMKYLLNNNSATNGTVVAGGNGAGNASNQLNVPTDVIVDASGTLYIADGGNHRIQRWFASAMYGDTIVGTGIPGTAANQLNTPEGLRFDEQKNLLVVDRSNNRIQMFKLSVCSQ
ncbi:unnamed protein product, partial [Adineta steineri]